MRFLSCVNAIFVLAIVIFVLAIAIFVPANAIFVLANAIFVPATAFAETKAAASKSFLRKVILFFQEFGHHVKKFAVSLVMPE